MFDLIVIGGGPAGTTAAIIAARGGARVLLLERGRFPRHKVCGEFVSAESLALLSVLLVSEHAALLGNAIRIPHARIFLDGRTLETPVAPPAASITRLDLDAALWESAEKFQAFGEKLMPLIQQAGLKPDEPIVFPAHNFVNQ